MPFFCSMKFQMLVKASLITFILKMDLKVFCAVISERAHVSSKHWKCSFILRTDIIHTLPAMLAKVESKGFKYKMLSIATSSVHSPSPVTVCALGAECRAVWRGRISYSQEHLKCRAFGGLKATVICCPGVLACGLVSVGRQTHSSLLKIVSWEHKISWCHAHLWDYGSGA